MIELLFVITALSLVGGTVAAAIAWRTLRENRRRSAARVARLAEAIYASEPQESGAVRTPHLLDAATRHESSSAARIFAAVAVLTAVLVAAGVARTIGRAELQAKAGATETSWTSSSSAAIELVSLVHERGAGGQLELRGEVHDPANGATLEGVTAVAMLFDTEGAYLASGRAPLEVRDASRSEATFAISIPDAADARRYRVSFRTHDRVIPHIDRRGER